MPQHKEKFKFALDDVQSIILIDYESNPSNETVVYRIRWY